MSSHPPNSDKAFNSQYPPANQPGGGFGMGNNSIGASRAPAVPGIPSAFPRPGKQQPSSQSSQQPFQQSPSSPLPDDFTEGFITKNPQSPQASPELKVEVANTQASFSAPPAGGKVNPKKRLGDVLTEMGAINEDQLKKALSQSKASKRPLGMVLVRMGFVSDETLGRALAELHHLEYVALHTIDVAPDVLKLLPEEFIKRHLIVPIRANRDFKRLEVAMARPDKTTVLDEIALLTGYRPVPKVSTHRELIQFFDKYFKQEFSGDEALKRLEEDYADQVDADVDGDGDLDVEDAPVVQLVNAILVDAIECGASDIHLEPQRAQFLIRYRVDGILREAKSIPMKMSGPVLSRIKVSSGMDIAERRRPQDGRMRIKVGSQEVDMRVSTIPIQFGEKICIRILRSNVMTGGLNSLGLTEQELKTMNKLIKSPNGIVLVTGPTGSGKTTTLYSCLRELNSPEVNISTAEDPIEYPLAGINQVAINTKAGITFSSTLRALLRQDPDIILVGEIRDEETLEAAIHASLTGHLVFSTLHTNSAAKTITRLLEMGAPEYLVSSAVVGIIAQRLVRRVCPDCAQPVEATAEERELMGMLHSTEPLTLHKGQGCPTCEGSGYSGRLALYEIMRLSREVQELVDQKGSTNAIQDMAVKQGMKTLGMDAREKIRQGLTTVDEAIRVLGMDWE